MKAILFLTFLFCLSFHCFSQDSTMAHRVGDTLVTATGFKIGENQKLKIGLGSTPDGSFKFITVSPTSFLAGPMMSRRAGGGTSRSLPGNMANHEMKVVRFDRRGSKQLGYVEYPIVTSGNIRWEVDIDNAIKAGEIVVPDEYKPKVTSAAVIVQPVSVADELRKLKKLLDEGVITQEEFDAQKKKLLNQ